MKSSSKVGCVTVTNTAEHSVANAVFSVTASITSELWIQMRSKDRDIFYVGNKHHLVYGDILL